MGLDLKEGVVRHLGRSSLNVSTAHVAGTRALPVTYRNYAFGMRPRDKEPLVNETLRERIFDTLESRRTHMIIVALIIIDALLVLTELILEFEKCESDDEERREHLEEAAHILHTLSLAILSIFMVEVIVKLCVYSFKYLRRHKFEVVDMAIVVVSFFADLLLSEELASEVGITIILRLWRITRIINGFTTSIEINLHDRLDHNKRLLRASERAYSVLLNQHVEVLAKLEKLEDQCRSIGQSHPRDCARCNQLFTSLPTYSSQVPNGGGDAAAAAAAAPASQLVVAPSAPYANGDHVVDLDRVSLNRYMDDDEDEEEECMAFSGGDDNDDSDDGSEDGNAGHPGPVTAYV